MWQSSRHRVLFNADTNFLFNNIFPPHDKKAAFDVAVLHDYVNMLADSGVDTLLINPNAQVPWYPSEKLPTAITGYTRGDHTFLHGHYPPFDENFSMQKRDEVAAVHGAMLDRFLDLYEGGIDWVEEMIVTAKKRGMSPWVSVRMNDAHGANSWENSFMNPRPLRDPASRLQGQSGATPGMLHNEHMLMNYACQSVRDYMTTMIQELLERYAFDGMELDWVRTAHCCEPPATKADIDTMTHWHGDVRKLAHTCAKKIGRDFPMGLRVPARVRTMRSIGIDVFELAHKGMIDFIGPSNFWQTTWDVPVDEYRAKLPANTAIFGVVDDAPNWLAAQSPDGKLSGTRMLSASPQLLRGNAAGKLAMGCEAIEAYNFFCSDECNSRNPDPTKRQGSYPTLAELGSLDTLRGKPKQYALATMAGGYMYPFFEAAEQLPAIIPPGQRKAFRLSMCGEPDHAKLKLVLQLVFKHDEQAASEHPAPVGEIGVSYNGSWPSYDMQATDQLLFPTGAYTRHMAGHHALNVQLDPAMIEEGWNEIVVFNAHASQSIEVISVELAII